VASTLLPIAALILVSGIGVQLLARRVRIPSVVFYRRSRPSASGLDPEAVHARISDSQNVAAFEALDITAIDSPMATVFAIDNEIERPELAHWMYDLSGGHDIQEVEMTAEGLVGESIRSLRDRIPGGCLVARSARAPAPTCRIRTNSWSTGPTSRSSATRRRCARP